MRHSFLTATMLFCSLTIASAQSDDQPQKLSGTVIGTELAVDYGSNQPTTTKNTRENAFDGDLDTYFATYERSYTWVGLDLGQPCVISRIGWAPAFRNNGGSRIVLGVFEGANSPDFMDALPLYMITEPGTFRQMEYADVNCSKGFRYVRYVSPPDMRCNIGELEFYGRPGEGTDSVLYRITNLPTVSIHTENGVIPYDKIHQINSLITIISDKGKELQCDSGTIRQRGNGSNTFPKHPFRIKFNKKQHVLDAPAKAKKWTLINNYGDKTLMRNMIAFEMSRRMNMEYTPYIQSVDVLLNGEYQGNYQLCDQVDVRKKRVNVEEMTPEDNHEPEVTGGYLIEIDARASSEPSWFMSDMGNPVTLHYPDDDEITPEQYAYINNVFNTMEKQWETYLDQESFLRHFLIGELSGNTDTYYSVFMYKHRDNDTLYTGPVWDFDLAFENDRRTYPINGKSSYIYRSGGSYTGKMKTFVDNIVLNNEAAKARLLEIWEEARQGYINREYLFNYIDEQEEYLQQAQELNFKRWPVMNELVHQNPVIWGSYEAEVQNVRRFIEERLEWMDNKLGYTYVPSGITNTDIDIAQSCQIYNLSGQPCGDTLHALPKGIYIIKQGRNTRKVQIR